jgi:hypothetical protein
MTGWRVRGLVVLAALAAAPVAAADDDDGPPRVVRVDLKRCARGIFHFDTLYASTRFEVRGVRDGRCHIRVTSDGEGLWTVNACSLPARGTLVLDGTLPDGPGLPRRARCRTLRSGGPFDR